MCAAGANKDPDCVASSFEGTLIYEGTITQASATQRRESASFAEKKKKGRTIGMSKPEAAEGMTSERIATENFGGYNIGNELRQRWENKEIQMKQNKSVFLRGRHNRPASSGPFVLRMSAIRKGHNERRMFSGWFVSGSRAQTGGSAARTEPVVWEIGGAHCVSFPLERTAFLGTRRIAHRSEWRCNYTSLLVAAGRHKFKRLRTSLIQARYRLITLSVPSGPGRKLANWPDGSPTTWPAGFRFSRHVFWRSARGTNTHPS